MVFCLSIIAPAIIVAPAQADTLDDIISETNAVYQFLDDTNKADIRAARSNLQTKDIDWDSILSPLLTDQVIEKFDGSEETAREKAKIAVEKFITATTEILYSQDADELKNTLIDYKNNNPEFKEFFQTLFGIGITLDDLYNFLSDTRAKLPDVISIADAPILANGNNQELINKIPKYMVDAMELAKELPANTQFNGKLAALGWSSKELVDQMQALAAVIDPDSKAQLAFALAAVRSETKMISPATVTVGQTPTFTIKIMGIDVTNFVAFYSTDSSKLEVSKNPQTGNFVFNAIAPGTVKVIVYRDYTGANPALDWLLEFNVNIVPEESDNALLSELIVTGQQLRPVFSPNIADYTVILTADPGVNFPVVSAKAYDGNANVVITQAQNTNPTAKIVVTASDGITKKTYTVTFSIEKPIPAGGGTITVGDIPVTIKPEVKSVGTQKEATLPALEVTGGAANVVIPANITVIGPAEWDGAITMPTAKEAPSAAVDGSNIVVIEVGAGKDANGKDIVLTFNKAVKIVLEGQKGKAAAYTRNGKLIPITRTISQNNQDTADREIPDGEEAYIDSENDKIIWTKHFTEFLSYTPTPTPDPGGGGGGAASFKGTTVKAATGGQINEAGAVIDIPANAFTSDFKVKVEKVSNIANLPIPEKSKFISDVIEITKDKSGNFSKPVTITLTFDKDEVDTNKYDLALYWLDTKTNKWSILDSVKLDMDAGKVSGDINHFTKFAVIATEKAAIPPEVVLTDIAGHWAEANIKALVATGAIAGYPDNTFKPNNNITRAEFASILVRAFNLEPKAGKIFNDTANSWAKDSIATAYAYGIIQGYSDTTFGPDDLITREQMAVMVVKAANLTDITNSEAFVDNDKISDWAQDAVAIAKANGIIAGYPDNTFNPQGNATRAEAATVILNAINK
jgi:hypothetical protein